MSDSTTPPAPHRVAAALRNMPVGRKLTCLVGAGLLAVGTCVGVTLYSGRVADRTAVELANLNNASAVVLRLDTAAATLRARFERAGA